MSERPSRPYLKVAAVAGGYAASLAIAVLAVVINVAETNGPVAQASSGMYAFGDLVLFVAVFGLCSLVPTALGLFYLRRHRYFWIVIGVLGIGLVLSIAAVLLFVLAVTGT